MATLVASLGEMPSDTVTGDVERSADRIEVRADLLGHDAALALAERFRQRCVYTLRSREHGGRWEGDSGQRRQAQERAAELGCIVDLELHRDDDPDLHTAIPEGQRLWSWHGAFSGVRRLRDRLAAMRALGGAWYKLVPTAVSQADVLAVLSWLTDQPDNVIAFAAGEASGWGRILASRWGAGWVYLSVGAATGHGQLSLERWRTDGYDGDSRPERVFGVVGSPVGHSLSPRIHNAAYRQLGLDSLYLPFEVPDFADFWLDVVESEGWSELGCGLEGMSVTAPHKRVALAVAGASSPLSAFVGAANTLVRDRGVWEAETTDPDGVRLPMELRALSADELSAAVVGAGGAGRAAVVALQQAGARVTLVNRGTERGVRVSERFQVPFVRLENFRPSDFALLVHATSVGRGGEDPPFEVEALAPGAWVVDMVYRDSSDGGIGEATELVRRASARGLTVIDGREVLLAQARLQFRMMTGQELSVVKAAQELGLSPDVVSGGSGA